MQKNISRIAKKFSHYVIGFTILIEGISEAEDFTNNWPYVILFCAIGILIFIFSFYEQRIEQKWVKISPLIQILESIVLFFVGIMYTHHGKQWLPYVVFLAALGSLTAGVVQLVRLSKK
jgi:peptidoglycan/LPS O-acetylase OafA/YrhL